MKRVFLLNDKLFYKTNETVQMYLIKDIQQCDRTLYYQIQRNRLIISIQIKTNDEYKRLSLQLVIPKKYEYKKILGLISYQKRVVYSNKDIEKWCLESTESNLNIENIILQNLGVNKNYFYDCITELKRVISKVNEDIKSGRFVDK